MMPSAHDSEYCLEREIYIDAETDGYDGVKPRHDYPTYLQAYIAGCRRKLQRMFEKSARK